MGARIEWLGHSAFRITSPEGRVILTDPWIDGNPFCPIGLSDIHKADVILVSHDHADHVGSAVHLATSTGSIVCAAPETAGRLQAQQELAARNVVGGGIGMNVGGSVEVRGIWVTMTQAIHSSETASAYGFIVEMEDGTTIYHAGDTGIFASMGLLGELYVLDLALLPIGGFFTMDPYQAAKALKLLRPRVAIPMHFRTFPMLEQDASRFVDLAEREAPEVRVVVLEPGQEFSLEDREA